MQRILARHACIWGKYFWTPTPMPKSKKENTTTIIDVMAGKTVTNPSGLQTAMPASALIEVARPSGQTPMSIALRVMGIASEKELSEFLKQSGGSKDPAITSGVGRAVSSLLRDGIIELASLKYETAIKAGYRLPDAKIAAIALAAMRYLIRTGCLFDAACIATEPRMSLFKISSEDVGNLSPSVARKIEEAKARKSSAPAQKSPVTERWRIFHYISPTDSRLIFITKAFGIAGETPK